MQDHEKIVAISESDHKQAALFFDRIYPLSGSQQIPSEVQCDIFLKTHYRLYIGTENINDFTCIHNSFPLKVTDLKTGQIKFYHEFGPIPESKAGRCIDCGILKYFALEAQANGFYPIPVVQTKEYLELFSTAESEEVLEITLGNLKIVDTESAQWEQILEFRKDKDAKRKLRNFRLFFHNSYKDKSPAHIKDSLDQKIEEYEAACKKHGLGLLTSSLTTVVDSKTLLGAIGLATFGVLLGSSPVITTAVLSGSIIETSKVLIKLSERILDFRLFRDNHELAFIVDAKKKFDER